MPDMDGLEFLDHIRANPKTKDLGVIIVTAWEDSNKLSKAREGRVVGYLKKPIRETNLITAIEHYFAGEGKEMIEQTRVETIEREKWVKENIEANPSEN
jgi:response regulator RpfG family c-di-GMP phosphodiesterase